MQFVHTVVLIIYAFMKTPLRNVAVDLYTQCHRVFNRRRKQRNFSKIDLGNIFVHTKAAVRFYTGRDLPSGLTTIAKVNWCTLTLTNFYLKRLLKGNIFCLNFSIVASSLDNFFCIMPGGDEEIWAHTAN
jgi:hypothetical protein